MTTFSSLNLSQPTLKGLQSQKFTDLTDVQSATLPLALKNKDLLVTAKTGSGKTLSFLIPVLERLYKAKWSRMDGLGALIISPLRELSIQIYEVLIKIGKFHDFSAGLVIGGNNFEEEQEAIASMNILVATPGRLVQHIQESPYFTADNLQILVLDEADRVLDLGFYSAVKSIIDFLPANNGRQNLLFSATQTSSVSDLARLSLSSPVDVDLTTKYEVIPSKLQQRYILIAPHQKLNMLFSFIRTHLNDKIIVFLSSCKQVQYVYSAFCHLRPGISLLHLHGKQKQHQRTKIYYDFKGKSNCVLFCTDVVARGLDFPDVSWVVQVDCPDDSANYIHRVGRTARIRKGGKALLFLSREELKFLERLKERNVSISETSIPPTAIIDISATLTAMLVKHTELKELAQKAFVSYIRSIYLQPDKDVFNPRSIDLKTFGQSFGLNKAPRIRFIPTKKSEVNETNWRTSADDSQVHQEQESESEVSDGELFDAPIAGSSIYNEDEVEKPKIKRIVFDESLLEDLANAPLEAEINTDAQNNYLGQLRDRLKSSDELDKKRMKNMKAKMKKEKLKDEDCDQGVQLETNADSENDSDESSDDEPLVVSRKRFSSDSRDLAKRKRLEEHALSLIDQPLN
ncbi:hypothetical protein RCL1_001667 [Eukaryota sp. TZLM3-RCL]